MVSDEGDDRRGDPKYVSIRRLIPNMITTAALCCGVASLHFASRAANAGNESPDWTRALIAIGVAAILDALDGRAARLLRVASPFGATLDSLADFVAFGIAPAFLLFRYKLHELEPFGLIAAVVYTVCAALRLARFTAMAKRGKGSGLGQAYFMGMPTPAAAGIVLIPLLLFESKKLDVYFPNFDLPAWAVLLHTLVVAGLMISRLPMYSLKGTKISRGLAVPLMVLVGAIVVSAARDPLLTLAVLSAVYFLSAPASIYLGLRSKNKARSMDLGTSRISPVTPDPTGRSQR